MQLDLGVAPVILPFLCLIVLNLSLIIHFEKDHGLKGRRDIGNIQGLSLAIFVGHILIVSFPECSKPLQFHLQFALLSELLLLTASFLI